MIEILKLASGIEVVGDVEAETQNEIIVSRPLQINYRYFVGSTPSVSFIRYVMFAAGETVSFDRSKIMHVVHPRDAFVDYYRDNVGYYYSDLEEMIDEELQSLLVKQREYANTNQEHQLKKILEMMPIEDATVN